MHFNLIDKDCSPLVINCIYEIDNKDLSTEYVEELLLGEYIHMNRIINSLSTIFPIHQNDSIDKEIKKMTSPTIEKLDSWVFQMISCIVMAHKSDGEKFFSMYPHIEVAEHGIGGLVVVINDG